MVFDAIPENTPMDALVLRVSFATEQDANTWPLVGTAEVQDVVRGDYDGSTVRVAIPSSSCDDPFAFGGSGLITGRIITPEAGQAGYARQLGDRRSSWPFDEAIFVPMTETVAQRRARLAVAH